jgi:hypothetical protein
VRSLGQRLIARRCSERRFFLRPDEETNNAFTYCLILAAQLRNSWQQQRQWTVLML